jgi:polyhydroxybutyrate depolymerase
MEKRNKWLKTFLLFGAVLMAPVFVHAQYFSMTFDSYERTYLLHLPTSYTGEEVLPMIIAMHGGFGSADNLQNQSKLSEKADTENFIVVYPEGVKGGVLDIRTWNAGWCCGYASNSNIDDVGFIDAMLDTLIQKYAIDTTRIYAIGMSNGGFMAYRLACELSNRIAAIAPVSASMAMTDCYPSRPVPIIHFHSFLDSNVPYKGGVGDGVSNHYNPPLDSVLNAWATMDNCVVQNDTIMSNSEYTHVAWSGGNCGSEIQLYITEDGGHSWPGGRQTIVGDPVSNYINADDLMWDFFQQYSLDCETTDVLEESDQNKVNFEVFPNPTNGNFTITLPDHLNYFAVAIYNSSGKQILKSRDRTTFDISNQPSGIYYVSIQTRNKKESRKIIRKE